MRPNSVLSTSSSSSDEHDNLSFYRVSKKGAYERSSSVTEGRNLERIPEDPGEYFPDVRRRGSLPGDFNIGYSMRKRLPSGSLLSPTSTDFFRKNALGNRFLDDFSLLIEKYGFTSPTDVSGHEAIPEENDFFEQEPSAPKVHLVSDNIEDALVKKSRTLSLHESITEEDEQQVSTFIKQDEYLKVLQRDEFSGLRRQKSMPLTEAIKEEDEGHAVELKHDKFLERVIEQYENFTENAQASWEPESIMEVEEGQGIILKHDKFMDKIRLNNEKFTKKRKLSQTTPEIIPEVDEGLGIELKHLMDLQKIAKSNENFIEGMQFSVSCNEMIQEEDEEDGIELKHDTFIERIFRNNENFNQERRCTNQLASVNEDEEHCE